MTSDTHLRLFDADYFELQRQYRARGFDGESHDMACLRMGNAWRLVEGAEPSHWVSGVNPAQHMRYGPYK
jgi:hypothetical protein